MAENALAWTGRPGHPAWRLIDSSAGQCGLQHSYCSLSAAGQYASGCCAGHYQAGRARALCLAPRHDLAPTVEDRVPKPAAKRRPLPGDWLMEASEMSDIRPGDSE